MATTKNLLATVNWAQTFMRFQPLAIGGLEPAVTSANMVLQTMLGAPFRWPWNRSVVSFPLIVGQQDYTQSIPNFGFVETVSVSLAGKNTEITHKRVLALDGPATARPAYMSTQNDNDADNIELRFTPPPDAVYTATVTVQNAPLEMTSLGSLWNNVPDKLGFVYNWGFLSFMALLMNDARFQTFSNKFIANLLGQQQGLTEMEINIFLGNYYRLVQMTQGAQLTNQQGITARANS